MLEINELDVVNCRKVNFVPRHFVKIRIDESLYMSNKIEDWIRNRLKNRYALEVVPALDHDNKLRPAAFAAFEDQKELTYFMLACPYFRRIQ